MKKNNYLIFAVFLFISAVTLQSCGDDDVSYVLSEVSAPTKVSAAFTIAQDDSGAVTITPTAEGATTFQVYFGDMDSEEPTTVSPGADIEHAYPEGNYTVRVVAVGLTGLTSEYSQNITISFRAPQDLTFEVTKTALSVSVAPTAVNATMYDVYFGENDNEEPVSVMDGNSAEYTYAAPGDYTITVIAKGAGAATIEATQVVSISGASDPVSLPITFDNPTVNYAFTTFNGASFEVVDNPDLSGENTEASQVGAITNSGNAYEGGAFDLGTPVDFSGANKTITMKLWSQTAVPVLVKFEGGVNGERQTEVTAQHGGTGWEILSFDFATDAIKSYIDGNQGAGEPFVPTGQYAGMVLFIDGPGTTAGTFYIDDIAQSAPMANSRPEFPIDFESVDLDYTFAGFGGAEATMIIDNPDKSGINMSSRVVEMNKTSGAQTYAGATLTLNGPVDFSAGTIIKMKVWSPRVGTPILFKMEDSNSAPDMNGNPSVFVEVTTNSTVAMQWEELTFDLTSSTGFDTSIPYNRLILFGDFGSAGNGELFYFDDIALTGENGDNGGDPDATEPVLAAPTPTLDATNVIAMFSDAYTNVAVDTWRTDWSAAQLENVTIAGNATKKYTELNFVGIETVGPNLIDASSMTHFHTDVWSADFTQFAIKLVDFGPDGAYQGGDDVEHEITIDAPAKGEWVSIDIPLSDFAGLTTRAHIAQLIYVGKPEATNTVYVDNVYFHN